MLKLRAMTSPASRIALSAALAVASFAAPVVQADEGAPEVSTADAPPADGGAADDGADSDDDKEYTSGDDLMLELTVSELLSRPPECKFQCCHTVNP